MKNKLVIASVSMLFSSFASADVSLLAFPTRLNHQAWDDALAAFEPVCQGTLKSEFKLSDLTAACSGKEKITQRSLFYLVTFTVPAGSTSVRFTTNYAMHAVSISFNDGAFNSEQLRIFNNNASGATIKNVAAGDKVSFAFKVGPAPASLPPATKKEEAYFKIVGLDADGFEVGEVAAADYRGVPKAKRVNAMPASVLNDFERGFFFTEEDQPKTIVNSEVLGSLDIPQKKNTDYVGGRKWEFYMPVYARGQVLLYADAEEGDNSDRTEMHFDINDGTDIPPIFVQKYTDDERDGRITAFFAEAPGLYKVTLRVLKSSASKKINLLIKHPGDKEFKPVETLFKKRNNA